ncbi:LysR substrate-binding domain-containing protein, partial [uncultured Variovorax sp.]|uniref:LysR substrate-binding domain-containing protein n=1 Tax=uncultured Variovorax sp. TaxID=114708 RepID=UPI0025D75EFE
DELCVLTANANRLHRQGRLRWADLHAAAWMVPPKETLVRQAFMTAFLDDGVPPPVPVIEAISSVTIGTLLRHDPTLVCAVRLEHASDELARGGVRRLNVTPKVPLPSFGLFFRRDGQQRSPAMLAFADAVRQARTRRAVFDAG